MDCSKNPHGFLFGFSHIKFGISGNGILPPTWAKKLRIFGASSVGAPPSAPGNKSSWSLELLGQSGCSKPKALVVRFADSDFWLAKVCRWEKREHRKWGYDVWYLGFLLMNVLIVIFYILLRRWLMFNVGWQHGWLSLSWTMHYVSTI